MYSVTRCNEAGDSVTSDPVNAFSNKRIEGYGVLDVILVKGHRLFCGGGWQRAAVVVWRPAQLITTLAWLYVWPAQGHLKVIDGQEMENFGSAGS